MYLFLYILLILFKTVLNINSKLIGQIKNVSLNVPNWSVRLFDAPILNGTCEQCLCMILTNSSYINSTEIGSFNCFINNKTCQVFSNKRFYQFWLSNDLNSNLYILEQPTILNNSNLVAWHSFDNGSYADSSGNGRNASHVVDVLSVPGKINQAIRFYSNSSIYQIYGFENLGQQNNPYSVALWIYVENLIECPILHLSSKSNAQGWCIDMFGIVSDGRVVARSWQSSPVIVNGSILQTNQWIHLTATYQISIGLKFYINGILIDQSQPFAYSASGVSDYITLANSLSSPSSGSCAAYMFARTGIFQGFIDELRVYSINLSDDDIYALANP